VGGYSGIQYALVGYKTLDGKLDTTFGRLGVTLGQFTNTNMTTPTMGTSKIRAIRIVAGNKILAAGTNFLATSGSVDDVAVARFNANGTPDDPGFNPRGNAVDSINYTNEEVSGLAVDSAGRIVVAGVRLGGTTAPDSYCVTRWTTTSAAILSGTAVATTLASSVIAAPVDPTVLDVVTPAVKPAIRH
jgi:hypothetical protein